jgi:putrescine transport system substrate-binding protein
MAQRFEASMQIRVVLLMVLLFAFFAIAAAFAAETQEKSVNVYNWSDYIDPKVIEDFTKETGIKVVYDTYDSNEVLETRLLAGQTGYDIVVPSGPFLQRQTAAGLYRELDTTKLANAKYLWPEIMARLAVHDPGNRHAVDYSWFTTGIAFNVEKASARLGGADPGQALASWDVVFKPDILKKFADCGIYVLDSPDDLFAITLNYLGLNPDSKRPADFKRVGEVLGSIRRYVTKFHSSEYINALANGDICLAIGWSGDVFQARDRAREAQNGVEIGFVIPKQGTLMSLDALAILKDAPHPNEALTFIDFLLRPEIAARNTNRNNFANGVLASKPYIDKAIVDNKAIYPDAEVMQRLFTVTGYDQPTQKLVTREWIRIKTGR